MTNTWLTTDWHLAHANMCLDSYEGRPSGYEELILKNLIEALNPGDRLVNLGDVVFGVDHRGTLTTFIDRLRAAVDVELVLIRGNHDRRSVAFYESCGFNVVIPRLVIDDVILSHRPVPVEDNQLNIHGHLHSGRHRVVEGNAAADQRHVLLGIENTGFRPVLLTDVGRLTVVRHGLNCIVVDDVNEVIE